ncbi:MAG TPA: hypothetical protein VEY10_08635 [Flavisolibacter sp.]|nr:hypothetical protein [Flavisolibacter sp.]
MNDRITFESVSGIGMRKVSGMKYVATNNNSVVKEGIVPYNPSTFNFGLSFTLDYHF